MLIRLKTLDNREFAATFTPLEDRWGWIRECVAERFECDVDDVHAEDDDEGFDYLTVRGERVARIERIVGWTAL